MSTTRAAPGRGALVTAAAGLALAVTLAGARTTPGQDAVAAAGAFLEYYAGVFTLVTLTGAVVFGVVATLRVLPPGPRVVVQALHRSAAVTAVGFLITHALLKIMEAHAGPLDLLIPTSADWTALGTVAGDLLVLAAATGAVRGRYAASVRPWMWRALHCTVYATWPLALAHGLLAGRPPKGWVTLSYVTCVVAVIGILLIRSATTSRREPPGSAPVPDLSDLSRLSGTRRGDRPAPGPGSFPPDPPHADPTGPPRTAPFPGDAVHGTGAPHGSRTAPTAASYMDAPPTPAPEPAPFLTEDPAAAEARLRAATGTASYVAASRHATAPAGTRTTGPFPTPEPRPASGAFGTRPTGGDPAEPFGFFRPAASRGTTRDPEPPAEPLRFRHRSGSGDASRTTDAPQGFADRPETHGAGGADPLGFSARTAPPAGPERVRERRTADEPPPRRRKGKKGKRPGKSVDEQDAEFWASLRAERRDWTRS